MRRIFLPMLALVTLVLLLPACRDNTSECTTRECLGLDRPPGDGDGDVADGGGDVADGDVGDGTGDASGCEEDERSCTGDGRVQVCTGGEWRIVGPCEGADEVCSGGRCVPAVDCEPGVVQGCSTDRDVLVCDASGRAFDTERCDDGLFCVEGRCEDVLCSPGFTRCQGTTVVEVCSADGSGYQEAEVCDEENGFQCSEGVCESPCDFYSKEFAYIGCSFWAADLPIMDDPTTPSEGPQSPAGVVFANLGNRDAIVTLEAFEQVNIPENRFRVPAGETLTVRLPSLNISGTSRTSRTFRLSATEPLSAYLFKPLGNVAAFSNDASLLLPESVHGTEYYVLTTTSGVDISSLPGIGGSSSDGQFGWFAVMNTSPQAATVRINFSTDIRAGSNLGPFSRGATEEFTLQTGEILNFESESEISLFPPSQVMRDMTGTRVTSDVPVAVFAGHKQAVLGEGGGPDGDQTCCADRLEQQMFPVTTWGTSYHAVKSAPRGTEPDIWRVIASRADTTITTTPSISGLDGRTLQAGEHVQVSTAESFTIEASEPIMVGQFLVSQQTQGVSPTLGDPAFTLMAATRQFRRSYFVAITDGYAQDFVVVVRPVGAIIRMDNQPLPEASFQTFGDGTHERGVFPVEAGAVRLEADSPFGVYVYGYDSAVSYGYPGGLDLRRQ